MIRRTKDEILLEMINNLLSNSKNNFNITSTSTVRLMLESIAYEIARLNNISVVYLMDKTLQTASGENLDAFGRIFNIERYKETTAKDLGLASVKFYIDPVLKWTASNLIDRIPSNIDAPTIDRINKSFIIRAGTILYSYKTGITFSLSNDVIFNSDDTYSFGGCIANNAGTISNIDINFINAHNIAVNQPELKDIAPFIFVTNISPINNGRDTEDDVSYRARIRNAILSNANANEIALRFAALSVPGVADVKLIKYIDGLGTTGIQITTTEPIANPGVYRAVYDACSKVVAVGETIRVIEPEYLAFGLKCSIFTKNTFTDADMYTLKGKIADYIINIPMGGTLYANQIISIIMSNSNINDCSIEYFKLGTLNLITGSILNMYEVSVSNIISSIDEKFYTDSSLLDICKV